MGTEILQKDQIKKHLSRKVKLGERTSCRNKMKWVSQIHYELVTPIQ